MLVGRLLKTLQSRLDQEEREWLFSNPVRLRERPKRFAGVVLGVAERHRAFALALSIAVVLVTLWTRLASEKYWTFISVQYLEIEDKTVYLTTLWSVQAAIVALVYPIVIGFVALLLEQSNNRSAIQIYLYFTAAQLAGLSAMALVAVMGFQYLLLPYVALDAVVVWALFDGLWFLINAVLTTFFLYRTFLFIRPQSRFEAIRSFTIAVAWPREARYHLARMMFQTACVQGLLPGKAYDGAAKEPQTLAGVNLGIGVPVCAVNLRRKRELRDIRFRFLATVVRSWLARADAANHQQSNKSASILNFPVQIHSSHEGAVHLCRIQGTTGLRAIDIALLRLSFVFGPALDRAGELTAKDILLELISAATAQLRSSEAEAFEKSINNWLELLQALLNASCVKDRQGVYGSLSTLVDTNRMFASSPFFEQWTRPLLDLCDSAAEKLSLTEDYFKVLVLIPTRLYMNVDTHGDAGMIRHFVRLGFYTFRRVGNWWAKTAERQGSVVHGPCAPVSLNAPFFAVYDQFLRSFVGSWETLKNDFIRMHKGAEWKDIQTSTIGLEEHLLSTLLNVIDSVLRGDRSGAEWQADVLIKWYGELWFELDEADVRFWPGANLLAIDLIRRDWNEVAGYAGSDRLTVRGMAPMTQLQAACIRNLWIDVSGIALFMLAMLGKNCECANSLAGSIFKSILSGTPLRGGGVLRAQLAPFITADGLVRAAMRQSVRGKGEATGYGSWIDGYVERVLQLSQGEMVSGRVYSGFGSNDFNSIADGLLFTLLILVVPKQQRQETRLNEILAEWSGEQIIAFRDTVARWRQSVEHDSFTGWEKPYECHFLGQNHPPFSEATQQLRLYLSSVSKMVEDTLENAIRSAPVSERRVKQIAGWASAKAFSKEAGAFPLQLFDEVHMESRDLTEFSMGIQQYQKGQLTDDVFSYPVVNEQEWFEETFAGHVGMVVLHEAIRRQKVQLVSANTAAIYWEEIKKFSTNHKSAEPILLVENPTIPDWIWQWAQPSLNEPAELPADLVVTHDRAPKSRAYVCSLNGMPVYRAPIQPGSSLLLTRIVLKRVEFTESTGAVRIEVKPIPGGRPDLVDLILHWRMDVRVDEGPALQLRYKSPPN